MGVQVDETKFGSAGAGTGEGAAYGKRVWSGTGGRLRWRRAPAAFCAAAVLALSPQVVGADDYVRDAGEIVQKADWARMRTVEVELYDYGYRPREIRLKAGEPYRIALKNTGAKHHYFTAPEFFRAIATRKAMVNGAAEVKAPYFTALEILHGGGHLDLYFVPVVRGTYKVHCPIDDHEDRGAEGVIVVE